MSEEDYIAATNLAKLRIAKHSGRVFTQALADARKELS